MILTRVGDAYRHLGDFDKAEEYYHRALNIEFDMYAVLGLAIISKERKNYLKAIESLSRLLANDPKNARLYIEIAECYIALDQRDKARDILTKFVRLGNKNATISRMLEELKD